MDLKYDPVALPEGMRHLPISKNGWVVPYFVTWISGEPEFRIADGQKWHDAVVKDLCWVCGQKLGRHKVFVLGVMCGITRTTVEPPLHRDCAVWSAHNCPFLARPRMERREVDDELAAQTTTAGEMIRRNPGVTLLWYTRGYSVFRDDNGKPLITVGEPDRLEFYRDRRKATRAEIDESIRTGLPHLAVLDGDNPAAMRELTAMIERFVRLLPA